MVLEKFSFLSRIKIHTMTPQMTPKIQRWPVLYATHVLETSASRQIQRTTKSCIQRKYNFRPLRHHSCHLAAAAAVRMRTQLLTCSMYKKALSRSRNFGKNVLKNYTHFKLSRTMDKLRYSNCCWGQRLYVLDNPPVSTAPAKPQ